MIKQTPFCNIQTPYFVIIYRQLEDDTEVDNIYPSNQEVEISLVYSHMCSNTQEGHLQIVIWLASQN